MKEISEIKMKIEIFTVLSIKITASYIPIEIDSNFLKSFNPMEIYRDPFRFDENIDNEGTKLFHSPDMSILSRILDQASGINEGPQSSSSYDPAWFVM